MADAQEILDTVNRIRQLSSQAFGLLSDEEKRAKLPEFEAGLKALQTEADARLKTVRDEIKTEADAKLAREEKIVTDMAKAAADMTKAADTIDTAATRLAGGIDLRVSGDGGVEVVAAR
jgi:hypothetical protein